MKIMKAKNIFTYLAIFSVFLTYSQVNVNIKNMNRVPYSSLILDCGTIDLESDDTVNINFIVELDKPYNQAISDGYIYIFKKKFW